VAGPAEHARHRHRHRGGAGRGGGAAGNVQNGASGTMATKPTPQTLALGNTGPSGPAPEPRPAPDGLYLYAIIRSSGWLPRRSGAPSLTRVRYRNLEALVQPAPFAVPEMDEARLRDHQRVVESAMRRGTVLPLPFGMVFQGRRAVIRFLEDQHIVLDEGLSFLDGHWELRLHLLGDVEADGAQELASHLYSDLRRLARAAIPLPAAPGRVLSAAFLVERGAWVRFVDRGHDLNRAHPELVFDLTGPWPPYDFVKIRP
jgi:hypothetical protein